MTKEKIREGIDDIIRHWNPVASTSANWTPLYGGITVGQDIVNLLDSQGLVRKVEGELPVWLMEGQESYSAEDMGERFKEAGYTLFERLI